MKWIVYTEEDTPKDLLNDLFEKEIPLGKKANVAKMTLTGKAARAFCRLFHLPTHIPKDK